MSVIIHFIFLFLIIKKKNKKSQKMKMLEKPNTCSIIHHPFHILLLLTQIFTFSLSQFIFLAQTLSGFCFNSSKDSNFTKIFVNAVQNVDLVKAIDFIKKKKDIFFFYIFQVQIVPLFPLSLEEV